MLSGIFTASFGSNLGLIGEGVTVFYDGRVFGGDAGYFWQGRFTQEDDTVTLKVQVANYRENPVSVFGPLTNFHLEVTGRALNEMFILTGHVVEEPDKHIKVICNKVSDLEVD